MQLAISMILAKKLLILALGNFPHSFNLAICLHTLVGLVYVVERHFQQHFSFIDVPETGVPEENH